MKFYNLLSNQIEESENPVITSEITPNFICLIPHAGTLYPDWTKEYVDFRPLLLSDTDLYTDQVYDLTSLGGIHIKTKVAFHVCNCNRARNDFSDNGVICKKTLFDQPVFKKEIPPEKVEGILKSYYDPYYSYVERAINAIKQKHGKVLIFDCHSMNSVALPNAPDHGEKRADFSVITNDGKSCNPKYEDIYYKTMKEAAEELTVNKNYPYKGGYMLKKFADPANGVHVIALEIKRAMYQHEVIELKEATQEDYRSKPDGIKQTNEIIKKAAEAVINVF